MADMTKLDYDVVVIGGGASGLMASAVASSRGRRVLLLEKNPELGRKLAITGGGRCNIMNAETDIRTLLSHYGHATEFLYSPFATFGPAETRSFFEKQGLPLKEESRQRIFPVSESATDVVAFFERLLAKHNVIVHLNEPVQQLLHTEGHLTSVRTSSANYTASNYILATGGLSHPETGTTGDGLKWLHQLEHTIHTPNPSLVPLIAPEDWVHRLSGTSLERARITFRNKAGTHHTTGRILFTHFGLSGPTILNSAIEVCRLLESGPVTATIDLFPGMDDAIIQTTVANTLRTNSNKALKNVLKELVPPGLSSAVAFLLPPEQIDRKVHSVTRAERQQLIELLRALPLTITGTKGNDWSIVSDGGIDLREVDTRTMRSLLFDNLFLTGDILHINRPSGGYSLQLCWTTGAVAGMNV